MVPDRVPGHLDSIDGDPSTGIDLEEEPTLPRMAESTQTGTGPARRGSVGQPSARSAR
jgi:hypothetical protein